MLVVDDLQWCDASSSRALAFMSRRLEGQPLLLMLATRPLDPSSSPEAAALVADPAVVHLRPSPLTKAAIAAMVAARLFDEPDDQFVRGCLEVTGGNPFLVGELLSEVAARGLDPAGAALADLGAIVPRGVANAVLLRLARLVPSAAALARALSVLGDGAQVGDAARLAGLAASDLESAVAALVSAGVVESGGVIRFTHPILRAAIYGDLSPAERERLHRAAAMILRERGAPRAQVAAQVIQTEPTADPVVVALLRDAAREALRLGDAVGAAALLTRGLEEPPTRGDRPAVRLADRRHTECHKRTGTNHATDTVGKPTTHVSTSRPVDGRQRGHGAQRRLAVGHRPTTARPRRLEPRDRDRVALLVASQPGSYR